MNTSNPSSVFWIIFLGFLLVGMATPYAQTPNPQLPWTLVWEDDFDQAPLDDSKWCRNDWRAYVCNRHDLNAYRTNPFQYAPDNVEFHDDGVQTYVRQVVKKENRTRLAQNIEPPYNFLTWPDTLSAPTWFISKARFKYGYYETRCRLPLLDTKENNLGLGANFWLWENSSTNNRLPESEIDVVEFVCDFPPHTHTCNAHHKTSSNTFGYHDYGSSRVTPNDGLFHTYGAWWGPDFVRFYIDGAYYRSARRAIPFLADELIPMQIILDINVFTFRNQETSNANTKFPYNFDIDYVRVYQLNLEQCNADYLNCSPMPALSSVYRTITFGGNSCSMPTGAYKGLAANTSITIQPEFEAPLGCELTLDIYNNCQPNLLLPCSTCLDCD